MSVIMIVSTLAAGLRSDKPASVLAAEQRTCPFRLRRHAAGTLPTVTFMDP